MSVEVEALESHRGHVAAVVLRGGTTLAADLVVVDRDAHPATRWLIDSGIMLHPTTGASCAVPTFAPACPTCGHAVTWPMPPGHRSTATSDWYGHRLQFAGLPHCDETLVLGDPGPGCIVLYRRDSALGAVFAIDGGAVVMGCAS